MQVGASSPSKDPNEAIIPGVSENEIEGTLLRQINYYSSQSKSGWSSHRCVIGILKKTETKREIIPILTLPTLENDIYAITTQGDVLTVIEQRSKRKILDLNIRNIGPWLIIK